MIKSIALATILAGTGCGALFNDRWQDINVTAPTGTTITLDGVNVNLGQIAVDTRYMHVFQAFRDGKNVGTCIIENELQIRYVVGDIFLFEMIAPLLIDGLTGDWYSPSKTFCNFQ